MLHVPSGFLLDMRVNREEPQSREELFYKWTICLFSFACQASLPSDTKSQYFKGLVSSTCEENMDTRNPLKINPTKKIEGLW